MDGRPKPARSTKEQCNSAGEQEHADSFELLPEQRIRRGDVTNSRERVGDERVGDDVHFDGHAPILADQRA